MVVRTVVFDKIYDGESIIDMDQDIFEAVSEENLPVDEHGFIKGDLHVVITQIIDN